MFKYFKSLILFVTVSVMFGSGEIKAETGSSGYIGPTSTDSSSDTSVSTAPSPVNSGSTNTTTSSNTTVSSNTTASSTSTSNDAGKTSSSTASDKSTTAQSTAKPAAVTALSSGVCTNASCASSIVENFPNVQASSVQVGPYSGSAGFNVPIQVPPGRAGIQPNLALIYNSTNRQLGNAGVGWTLDLGSIQISTKKGIPKYDGTDIFTMEQAGGTEDLVADPNTPGLYHMEVEGSFARIQYFTTYWLVTDKKGIKYYYGNTPDSTQNDPANPTHIFRWAINRVEDLNGNYMIISYMNNQGQIYPQTISYTGNDQTSLNLSTYAQVSISYAVASVPSTSYISKFLVETAQRINQITISVGPNVQSTYTLTYHQSAYTQHDLLQSVQQTGADGTSTMPPVSFTYSDTAPKGFQLDTSWSMSGVPYFSQYNQSNWQDLGVRIGDFNGDGYPDIVEYSAPWGGSTTNQVYLNNKQKSWAPTGNWQLSMNMPPDLFDGFDSYVEINRYTGLIMLDVDGDGLVDLIQNYRRDEKYGAVNIESSATNNGTNAFVANSAWNLPSDALNTYQLGVPVYMYTVPGATAFGSITGSGYPDIAVARTVWYPSNNVYLNNKELSSSSQGWTLSSVYSTPAGLDFTQGAALVDLNGDGLADIIYSKGGTTNVYMNTGNGWVLNSSSPWAQNIPSVVDLSNGLTQFIDVNGDGLPDIVYTNGSTGIVLINTGNGWVQDSAWALQGGPEFTNLGTQFLDANASGMQDYLISIPGQQQMYINQGQPADSLIGVNNGVGVQTSITYDSALHYQNTYLPYFIPVVKSTTTTIGSQSYTTTYNYAGGLWDKNYREFDGFSTVTITDPQGNYVTSSFLQDHWLRGHPSEQDTYDSNGNLYSKTVNTWQTQTIATNTTSNQISKFLYIARTDNYLYDGNSSATPKRTAQELTYGETTQYGDVTQVINDGQVDPVAGTSVDPNRTVTKLSYVYNTNNWIIGLPGQTTTQNTGGTTISKTSLYYDGDTTGTAVPVLGKITAKVNWLGSTTQADPKIRYTYDAYGNLQTTIDPNGNTVTITYDSTVHMFPVKTTNALNQSVIMTYYGIDASALNSGGLQGLWGQDRSETDANNQTIYTTHDTFGRLSTTISPLDSVTLPTEQKSYNFQPTYLAVTDIVRAVSNSTSTISTVSYYDGLGRLIENKTLGPAAGQFIVSGQTVYDNRGLPVTKYLPYFTSNNLNTMDPLNTTDPSSQAQYDPMGRVVTKINADGTYSSVAYNQWTTKITDENGHEQQNTVDAFGHLVQKNEMTGADGRSPYYPAAAYTVYATTSYSYDPKGNLTTTTDAHNNVTSITYDNVGRKISMNDPDMGKWQYGYDGNGNLIWQQDAKGQVISFTYDKLNRLITRTDGITAPIVNLPNVTNQVPTFTVNYHFDDPTQSYGIGRLGSVTYDTGSTGFIYDQLGREVLSNKIINGTNYNVGRQYDALNRLQQLQYPNGSQVAYIYNQVGQVTSVSD